MPQLCRLNTAGRQRTILTIIIDYHCHTILLRLLCCVICCYYFSDCQHSRRARRIIGLWRHSNRRRNHLTVERESSSCWRAPADSWQSGWHPASLGLTHKTPGHGTWQWYRAVHCLYDCIRSYGSALSVGERTTRGHCPISVHAAFWSPPGSPHEQIYMVAQWLSALLELLPLDTRFVLRNE